MKLVDGFCVHFAEGGSFFWNIFHQITHYWPSSSFLQVPTRKKGWEIIRSIATNLRGGGGGGGAGMCLPRSPTYTLPLLHGCRLHPPFTNGNQQGSQIYPSLGEANGPGQPTQTPCLGGAAQLLEDNILRGMLNLLGGNSVIIILFQHSKCFFVRKLRLFPRQCHPSCGFS